MNKAIAGTVVAALIAGAALPGIALAQRAGGLPACPPGAMSELDTPAAVGCWFKAARGGWRILVRDTHYDTFVYHVGADDLQDAEGIAKAVVDGEGPALGELMVYVYLEPIATSSQIRRVRWARMGGGYETLDFPGRVPEWMVPIQP